jgi:hypothetical protein
MSKESHLEQSKSAADRIPQGRWGRAWLIAFVSAALALATIELDLRARGFSPSVRDEPSLWGSLRASASGAGPNTIVLIGASRFQLGIDPQLLESQLNADAAFELSIDGSSPLPVLDDLAQDHTFAGTVLVEVTPGALFGTNPRPRQIAESWLADYAKRPRVSDLEVGLRLPFEERLVLFRPGLKTALVDRLLLRPGAPPFVSMRRDRYQSADFARLGRGAVHPSPSLGSALCERSELDERLELIRASVARIHNRGGRVVFVRMPSTGTVRELEELTFPRESTWERLVATEGVVGMHFEDHPELSEFDCPDGSHLDAKDVARFTSALARRLRPDTAH